MIHKYYKYICFVILFGLQDPVFSQDQNYRFTHFTTDNGLSQSNVTSIIQDHTGFLWFGTFNGLNRFDGYHFESFHYHSSDSLSISHNYISSLFEDRDGFLWVGTSNGLNRYDHTTGHFKSFKNRPDDSASISDNQIETILEDTKRRLWIGTRKGGLELYNPNNETFVHYVHNQENPESLSSNAIRKLFEDSMGRIWIGHWTGDLDILTEQTLKNGKVTFRRKKLTDVPITSMVESEDGTIWIGTQGDGLFRMKYENDLIRQVSHYSIHSNNPHTINSNIILCLLADKQNKIWIGTENNGINILDPETEEIGHYIHNPYDQSSLSHNSIWSLYEDRTGKIWIGTYAHGINLLTERKSNFQHFSNHPGKNDGLNNNMVNAFIEDKNNLWIATDGGGLNFFDREKNQFLYYNSENSRIATDILVSLFKDSRDRFWIGTWTHGLYEFNPTEKTFAQYTEEQHGLGSNRVLHISESNDGGLWLATYWGGLTYFNPADQKVLAYNSQNSGLSDNYVRVTYQESDSVLWIGTDSGLDHFNLNTNTFTHFKHDEYDEKSLTNGFIHCIVRDRDSTLWIGTSGGLNQFIPSSQQFVHYNVEDGLPNDEIKCIIEGEGSFLWLSTNNGLSQFDRRAETFKNYDFSDGLQGNEFNIRSGLKTKTGEIIFGGNNGFNIFYSAHLKDNPNIPPVVFTDFKIFNKSVSVHPDHSILNKRISETSSIRLSHNHAVFSFDYVALNYISPGKNQYAYMMEGFETEWNYVGSRRTATYTNLDPGDYVFRVKASNNDGLWNETGASIKITIDPPFWRTWWAYLAEFLMVIAIVYFILNYYISRQRLRNALEMEHMELEKMYEMDQMKTRFFNNIAHEFYSPITLILSPLEKLVKSSNVIDNSIRKSLILIHRNAKRLQRMTNQLKDLHKIETGDLQLRLSRGDIIHFIREIAHSFQEYATDHRIRYDINTEQIYVFAWFDPDKIDKIIYNLLSNAFKFTPDEGEVRVTVSIISSRAMQKTMRRTYTADKYIEISIQDSGIGIPEEIIDHIFERFYHVEDYNGKHYEGSGVGLAFVHEMIQLYKGHISVSSAKGQGSKFTVQIPIDEHFLEEHQLVSEFSTASPDHSMLFGPVKTEFNEKETVEAEEKDTTRKELPVLLIIDDDKAVRDYIRESLELNYRILSADNGKDGFRKAIRIIPDLIISDIRMPEVSGIELCNQLRDDERTSHVPIILLTAYSSNEFRMEGLSKGADAYVTKPFNIDILEAQIVNLLNSRRTLREKYSQEFVLGPEKTRLEDRDSKFLQRIINLIEGHISEPAFNAESLSKEMGLSRMQLYRKIRGLTNQTVHEFIRSIRLKRAVQLLKDKRMTITEVAYEVGFNDLTYFARCFRKQYLKSPSEYLSKKN